MPELLRGSKEGCAQPIVVLCLHLQAADCVLLPMEGHGTRPPVLPDPLPAGDAVAAQQRGQKHGVLCEQRPGTYWLRAQPRDSGVPVEVGAHSLSGAPTTDSKLTRAATQKPWLLKRPLAYRRKCVPSPRRPPPSRETSAPARVDPSANRGTKNGNRRFK